MGGEELPKIVSKKKNAPPNGAVRYIAPEAKKELLDALARLVGHVAGVRRMVEEEQCCDDILLQVAATRVRVECGRAAPPPSSRARCQASGVSAATSPR